MAEERGYLVHRPCGARLSRWFKYSDRTGEHYVCRPCGDEEAERDMEFVPESGLVQRLIRRL